MNGNLEEPPPSGERGLPGKVGSNGISTAGNGGTLHAENAVVHDKGNLSLASEAEKRSHVTSKSQNRKRSLKFSLRTFLSVTFVFSCLLLFAPRVMFQRVGVSRSSPETMQNAAPHLPPVPPDPEPLSPFDVDAAVLAENEDKLRAMDGASPTDLEKQMDRWAIANAIALRNHGIVDTAEGEAVSQVRVGKTARFGAEFEFSQAQLNRLTPAYPILASFRVSIAGEESDDTTLRSFRCYILDGHHVHVTASSYNTLIFKFSDSADRCKSVPPICLDIITPEVHPRAQVVSMQVRRGVNIRILPSTEEAIQAYDEVIVAGDLSVTTEANGHWLKVTIVDHNARPDFPAAPGDMLSQVSVYAMPLLPRASQSSSNAHSEDDDSAVSVSSDGLADTEGTDGSIGYSSSKGSREVSVSGESNETEDDEAPLNEGYLVELNDPTNLCSYDRRPVHAVKNPFLGYPCFPSDAFVDD